ncbi:MAG: ankyrin repeat domain-containing protein [Acidobacteriota bacterium]
MLIKVIVTMVMVTLIIATGYSHSQEDIDATKVALEANFVQAGWNGDLDTIHTLLQSDVDVNAKSKDGNTALMGAALNNRVDVIKVLLENGADIHLEDKYGNTALAYAVNNNSLEAVEMLLNKGAKVDVKDNVIKSTSGNPNPPSTDTDDQPIIITAASNGQKQIVKALIDKGVDVKVRNKIGKTALSIATEKEYKEIVKLLRAAGATE